MRLVVGSAPPPLSRPPRQARRKAPLAGYHSLAAGHDATTAMGVHQRLRKVTTWVPLEKVQSVRMVTGPVQRALSLSTAARGRGQAAGPGRACGTGRAGEADQAPVGDLAALSRLCPAPGAGARRSGGPGHPGPSTGTSARDPAAPGRRSKPRDEPDFLRPRPEPRR